MNKKILLIIMSCMLLLCMAQVSASATCRDDCFSSCCGGNKVCTDPVTVSCLSSCQKGCDGEKATTSAETKSSGNLNVEICKANNRREVQACNYPKRETQATRECLADARSHFDSCMQDIGR